MRSGFVFLSMLASALALSPSSSRSQQATPRPLAINLDPAATGYTPVLTGPPTTVGLRSGYVVLAPGTSVGRHSTERYEELIVVLSGAGELSLTGRSPLPLREGTVAYSPPHTEHDVLNTGAVPLRYLYIVAPDRR
jgi:quercetin dioxygenase-like cupin family protein